MDFTADTNQTRMLSAFFTRHSGQGAFLVRLHPVTMGEGVISLPTTKFSIGRDRECDLQLEDTDVSRKHAIIDVIAGEYMIIDQGSTNGLMVNDKRIERSQLRSGDQVRLGKTILKFLRGDNVEMQYHETVYSMMINDGLTGIPNKRYLLEALQRELTRSQRHSRPLSLVVMDIDHFKKINDTFGHLAGDVVLRELAGRVRKTIRRDEVFARYGGEEFVALLPESSLEEAAEFAERIRMLAAKDPVLVEKERIAITVSLGVAHTAGEGNISADEFFKRADHKLYQAKADGRNRVVS
jgi:two-component system cell cycle response regulator